MMITNEIHIRDPFIYEENGKYYLYGTNGMRGFLVNCGVDLIHWSEPKMIWSSFGEKGNFEAVSVSDNGEIDGRWVHEEQLLFEENGRHGMIFQTTDGKLKFVLQQPNSGTVERVRIYDIHKKNGRLCLS